MKQKLIEHRKKQLNPQSELDNLISFSQHFTKKLDKASVRIPKTKPTNLHKIGPGKPVENILN